MLRGVRILEPIDYEPIGWHEWRGFRLELDPEADVWPYSIGETRPRASWEAEQAPDYGVHFETSLPVWIGEWPRVWIHGTSHFSEGLLEVLQESAPDRSGSRLLLRLGAQVPVEEEGGRPYLDLRSTAELGQCYGPIRLSCRLPALPEQSLLSLRVIRTCPVEFGYVEAPPPFDHCAAVRIRAGESVTAGTGTRMTISDGVSIAWPEDPIRSPSVTLNLPDSRIELRVRTPVTRLRRLKRGEPPAPWTTPPLELRLADVQLDDRLRVELHLEPELEDGRPFCRLVGGQEVASGDPCRVPNTYDIPLNRWRESLGPEAFGIVQLRGTRRWVDLVRLMGRANGRKKPGPVPVKSPSAARRRILCELESAAVRENGDAVLRLVDCFRGRADSDGCPSGERELALIMAARCCVHLGLMTEAEGLLESLHERGDLYELTLIRASLDLRRGAVPRSEVPKRGRLLANLTAWCPLQQLIVAEYDSRYATGPGGGSAMWQSCLRRLNSVSWSSPNGDGGTPTLSIDGKEATLLRGLAMVMLGRVPDLPEGLPSQGQWAWLPMIRLAGRYLLSSPRHALGCDPVPATDLPAPSIIDERHADLIRLALNQAAGNIKASAKLLNRFCDFTNEEFFAIDLLRFRQYRLEDRNQEARDLYRDMLAWTRGNRQSPLLEILIEEYAS